MDSFWILKTQKNKKEFKIRIEKDKWEQLYRLVENNGWLNKLLIKILFWVA